jgi:hypothetical protein
MVLGLTAPLIEQQIQSLFRAVADQAFKVNKDQDPIRIQGFDDQKRRKKNTDLIKNCNLLMSKLHEKSSAFRTEYPALQEMKFMNFFYVCGSFLPPESGSRSTALLSISVYCLLPV